MYDFVCRGFMSDLKKVIFDYIRKNPDILQKENSNELLFKKFYPNVTEPEDVKYKKKYISKVKNEFLKLTGNFSETVPDKLGEVTSEPVKVIPGEIDLQVIKNVVSDKIKEKLILSVSEQQQLLELLKNPEPEQHPIKQIPIATGNGEKERYNIRILISAMDKLKDFAKNNNSNASAVIEYLINTYL